jgi:hypothetical protein
MTMMKTLVGELPKVAKNRFVWIGAFPCRTTMGNRMGITTTTTTIRIPGIPSDGPSQSTQPNTLGYRLAGPRESHNNHLLPLSTNPVITKKMMMMTMIPLEEKNCKNSVVFFNTKNQTKAPTLPRRLP